MYLAVIKHTLEEKTVAFKVNDGFFSGDYKKTWGVSFYQAKGFATSILEVPITSHEFKTFKSMIENSVTENIEPGKEFHLVWKTTF